MQFVFILVFGAIIAVLIAFGIGHLLAWSLVAKIFLAIPFAWMGAAFAAFFFDMAYLGIVG